MATSGGPPVRCVRLDAGWRRPIVSPTAPGLSELGFAAPARKTAESANSAIGLRVRSHPIPPPRRGRTSTPLHHSMIEGPSDRGRAKALLPPTKSDDRALIPPRFAGRLTSGRRRLTSDDCEVRQPSKVLDHMNGSVGSKKARAPSANGPGRSVWRPGSGTWEWITTGKEGPTPRASV
jgi:hypothetical protein